MRLFRRQHGITMQDIDIPIPGLAETAAARGWQPLGDHPLDSAVPDAVGDVLRAMYGHPTYMSDFEKQLVRIGGTVFRDSYSVDVDGRRVVVTNAWRNIQGSEKYAPDEMRGVAVYVAELPTVLMFACVQPRRFKPVLRGPEAPTGDTAFDEAYLVTGAPSPEPMQVLAPEVRQLISARDDWIFRAHRYFLACVCLGPFHSGDEAAQGVDDLLNIVRAFPTSVVPDHIDHSADDIVARASKLTTFEEALAFLQGLSEDERDQLAHSDSPLAVMADVRTPAEAMERFNSLDAQQKMQLYALVQRVKNEERGR